MNAYEATGLSLLIQCMGRFPLSTSGFTPKCFRNEFAQPSRDGCGRFSCPSSANRAAEVWRLAPGASNPK